MHGVMVSYMRDKTDGGIQNEENQDYNNKRYG
jgi:hypothetical protein